MVLLTPNHGHCEPIRRGVFKASVRSGALVASRELAFATDLPVIGTATSSWDPQIGSVFLLEPKQILKFNVSIPDDAANPILRVKVIRTTFGKSDGNIRIATKGESGELSDETQLNTIARKEFELDSPYGSHEFELLEVALAGNDVKEEFGRVYTVFVQCTSGGFGVQDVAVYFDVRSPTVHFDGITSDESAVVLHPIGVVSATSRRGFPVEWRSSNTSECAYLNLSLEMLDGRRVPIAIAEPIDAISDRNNYVVTECELPPNICGLGRVVIEPYTLRRPDVDGRVFSVVETDLHMFELSMDFRRVLAWDQSFAGYRIYEVRTGKCISEVKIDNKCLQAVLSPDGSRTAILVDCGTGGASFFIDVYVTTTGERLGRRKIEYHGHSRHTTIFASDSYICALLSDLREIEEPLVARILNFRDLSDVAEVVLPKNSNYFRCFGNRLVALGTSGFKMGDLFHYQFEQQEYIVEPAQPCETNSALVKKDIASSFPLPPASFPSFGPFVHSDGGNFAAYMLPAKDGRGFEVCVVNFRDRSKDKRVKNVGDGVINSAIYPLAIDRDGRVVAISATQSNRTVLRIYDVESGELLHERVARAENVSFDRRGRTAIWTEREFVDPGQNESVKCRFTVCVLRL
jgi:hypothetical protein